MTSDPTVSAEAVVRQRQHIYLGMIMAAPLAHIGVTLYRSARTVRHKQVILGVGVIGSTVLTVGMRLWLMSHAGYPGREDPALAQSRIIHTTSTADLEEVQRPSLSKQFKEALRGFG